MYSILSMLLVGADRKTNTLGGLGPISMGAIA